MRFHWSWFGVALAAVYVVAAVYFLHGELRSVGGEINLRGLGVALATLPSQWTFGVLFDALGWRVNALDPGALGYAQIGFHVLATASFFYVVGFALEWLLRRLLGST